MTTITYPLLYYPLSDDKVVGLLVGSNLQVVERDLKTLKSKMLDYLKKKYRKTGEYTPFDIEEPKVKNFEVKIRPAYREDSRQYPMSTTTQVNVTAVFGDTGNGHYECFLPAFNMHFYYYEPRQLKTIFNYFIVSIFNDYSPGEIYRYMDLGIAEIDTVKFRVNEKRNTERSHEWNIKLNYLDKLASKIPAPKQKRARQQLPDVAWELEDKVEEIYHKLVADKTNLLIVGAPGVGKSAVLRTVIRKLTSSSSPAKDRTFWEMRSRQFVSRAKYLGEWQEICEEIIEDLRRVKGTLYILDVIQLLQIGGPEASVSVGAFLLEYLQSGELTIISEVTPTELESMRRLLPGFVETFQLVKLDELPKAKNQAVFHKMAEHVELQMKIRISNEALTEMYRLLYRYFPYQKFPGKGIRFLAKTISEARMAGRQRITKKHVLDQFIEQSGMPELFLRDDLRLDNTELKTYFQERIIGQPQALAQLSGIVKVFKAGLNNPYKPIQTLLFAGPTGVGKTASAKALANYFFGKGQQQKPLVRIEMSEFQHPYQISKFIGAGKEVGVLVRSIRERPFSVLLLDEVEKAHPGIYDALMTVLDEGMMVDSFGRITNFRNCIIIMTTNLGASNAASIGFSDNESDKVYQSAIERFFRPEFVNRIDGTVFFNHLSQPDILKICHKELQALQKREGLLKHNLQLEFTNDLINFIARVGYDQRYGARPLQRAIADHITEAIAIFLLDHPKIKNKTLQIDYVKEEVVIEIQ